MKVLVLFADMRALCIEPPKRSGELLDPVSSISIVCGDRSRRNTAEEVDSSGDAAEVLAHCLDIDAKPGTSRISVGERSIMSVTATIKQTP